VPDSVVGPLGIEPSTYCPEASGESVAQCSVFFLKDLLKVLVIALTGIKCKVSLQRRDGYCFALFIEYKIKIKTNNNMPLIMT